MSSGFKVTGDSLIKDGVLYTNQVLPNNNTAGVVGFNKMTTAQLAVYNDPESTIVKNTDTGELISCQGLLRSQITNQVSNIAQTTFLGRRFGVGFGAPQTITPSSQFNFSGSGVDLIQPLNALNNSAAVLKYHIYNNSQQVSRNLPTEGAIKIATVTAGTLITNDDNINGTFAGTFINGAGDNATLRLYVNGVLVSQLVITSSPSGAWSCSFSVQRSDPTNLRCQATLFTDTAAGTAISKLGVLNAVFNPSAAFSVELRALTSTTSSTVSANMGAMDGSKNI